MYSCENKAEHSSLLVKKFEKSVMFSFINHIILYTHKQCFSVSSYREMCYFLTIFIDVKMLVCLHLCSRGLFHGKRKEQEGKRSPKEASISSEKRMGCGSSRNKLFLTK